MPCLIVPCSRLWWRSAGLKISDQPAGLAVSPHITTVHLPAATVFLSHTTSRYSVLTYFFRQANRASVLTFQVGKVRSAATSFH